MAALAGATDRLKFGMSVVWFRFATRWSSPRSAPRIDYLSNGRFLPAFGVGPAIAPEWQATGRSQAGSGALSDEALTLMTRLWTEDRVTFEGKYYRYTDVTIARRPCSSRFLVDRRQQRCGDPPHGADRNGLARWHRVAGDWSHR